MKLGDLITQIRGVSYKPSDVTTKEFGFPILRANNINECKMNFNDLIYINSSRIKDYQYLVNGDILVCTSSGSKSLVGKACGFCSYDTKISFGAFCKVIRINEMDNINPDFVRLFFRSNAYRNQISELSKGANINNIKSEDINSLTINIPSLDLQNECIFIVDKLITALDAKKSKLARLDEIIKSRFIEMFGDPFENPYSYSTDTLADVCPFNKYKGSIENLNNRVWLLNLDMVESNTGVIIDKIYIPIEELGNSTIKFDNNGVLYSKLRPYLNKVVIPDTSGYATSEMIYMETPDYINKYYLAEVLRSQSFVDFINSKSSGAKMPRVPMDFLREFKIMIPPIQLQNEFALFVEQIDKLKFIVQNEIKDLQELLDKKMEEYFRK